jgi:hypothetical protein
MAREGMKDGGCVQEWGHRQPFARRGTHKFVCIPGRSLLRRLKGMQMLLPWASAEGTRGRDLEVIEGLLDTKYLLSVPLPLEAADLGGRDPRNPP